MKWFHLFLLVVALPGCISNSNKHELERMQTGYNEGIVVKQSYDNISIKDINDEVIDFSTDKKTLYIPENYRSLEGDTVGIKYKKVWVGKPNPEYIAIEINSISVGTKNRGIESPVTAKLHSIEQGSYGYTYSIIIKQESPAFEMKIYMGDRVTINKSGREYTGEVLRSSLKKLVGLGNIATFEFSRVPLPRANGYIYVLHGVKVL